MTVQVNLRDPQEIADDLDRLAAEEHLSRVDVARQILLEGVERRKQALALQLYAEGKVSQSRAAEMAGVSLWEMMDLIHQAEVKSSYSLREAVEDIRRVIQASDTAPTTYRRIAEEPPDPPDSSRRD